MDIERDVILIMDNNNYIILMMGRTRIQRVDVKESQG